MNSNYNSPPPIDKNANDIYKSNLESAISPQSIAKILANKAKQNRALDSAMPQVALPAIVAGNGPSLKAIDYSRLPLNFEVFRCNQFYFEDKYYLGKRVKGYTATTYTAFSQVWTMLNLLMRDEYEIDKIFLHDKPVLINNANGNENKDMQNMKKTIDVLSHYSQYFTKANPKSNLNPNQSLIDRVYNGSFSHNIAEFLEWSNLSSIYYGPHITSGLFSCALAVAMGHREIYIVGIDLYRGDTHYFTNMRTPNILITGLFDEDSCDLQGNYKSGMQWHKREADIEALYFLQEAYNVKFYSLCESSPISELIPLAKKTNSTFTPQPKPKDYICDFCIPTKESFEFMQIPFLQKQSQAIQQIQSLKQNIYFLLMRDLFKLPSHIKHYIKGKIAKEKFKKDIKTTRDAK